MLNLSLKKYAIAKRVDKVRFLDTTPFEAAHLGSGPVSLVVFWISCRVLASLRTMASTPNHSGK